MAPARRSGPSGRRFVASISTYLACTTIRASAAAERTFLSGSADTSRLVHIDGTFAKKRRHHLVCFHLGGGYASTVAEGREKCCRELYQSGLLSGDDRRGYCLDHVALVPDLSSNSGDGGVRPAFYLALDKAADSTDASPKSYLQRRQLRVLEDKEQERLRDGHNGVDAYSPFHLEGLASDEGPGSDGDQEKTVLPLEGMVGGTISSEGGMHRAFRQRLTLSLSNAMRITENGSSYQRVAVNATILLPIPESVFIDADDALLVEYEGGSADGVACTAGVESSDTSIRKSTCSVDFIHPETIDIEQPAFASRQYVVAYQIVATLDLTSDSSGSKPEEGSGGLAVAIDYGTTLHVRYPSPIAPHIDGSLVPIVIEQPVLYAASATLEAPTAIDGSDAAIHFRLRTTGVNKHRPPDPIVIHVASGSDGDYGWVTLVTMASALIGGLMLMRSLDEASVWC